MCFSSHRDGQANNSPSGILPKNLIRLMVLFTLIAGIIEARRNEQSIFTRFSQ